GPLQVVPFRSQVQAKPIGNPLSVPYSPLLCGCHAAGLPFASTRVARPASISATALRIAMASFDQTGPGGSATRCRPETTQAAAHSLDRWPQIGQGRAVAWNHVGDIIEVIHSVLAAV